MDIQRHTITKPWLLQHWYALPLGAFVIALIWLGARLENTAYQTAGDNLAIGEVQLGAFRVTVRGNGTLVPKDVRWIAANVTGRVEAIYAKPGARVTSGDLILQMSNPELVQRAEEIAWELEALDAENKALQVSLESDLLNLEAQVLNAEMNYESAKINLDAENQLLKEGNATVSKIDYEKSVLETRQFLARWNIEKQRLAKLKENKDAQIAASLARYNSTAKSLARAQQQVESLAIRATLDGVLQEMPLEAGQQVGLGDNIAKLARQDQLIAELQIPERLINDVALGQQVTVDTRRSEIAGEVIRINPAVTNGTVQVDVAFVDDLPREARPDLSVNGTISVAQLDQTLFVGRPSFAQSSTRTSVYRLSDDGQFAERVSVEFGIGSANEIQVVEGLSPGQKIILSDSSAWEHLEKISIQ